MRRFNRSLSVIVVLCFFTTGCASIVSKSLYPVTINSSPDNATIVIKDEENLQIFKGETPTIVTLVSGRSYFHAKNYTVEFSKAGYENQIAYIKSSMNGWYIGNILFGGLIGLLIVDPITGAMYKLPLSLTVSLNQGKSASVSNEKTLQIISLNTLSPELRKQLVRIR